MRGQAPKGNILIADDELFMRESLSLVAREDGFNVATACDGREAMELILESQKTLAPIELLVTDMLTPQMTSLDLIQNLRSKGINIPAILVTAITRGLHEFERGIDNMFVKRLEMPFDQETFLKALHDVLKL